MLNSVYNINLNCLGVRSQESGVRSQESGGNKKKEELKKKVFCLAGAQRTFTLRDSSNAAFRTENPECGTDIYRALIRT
ncbi:hypothetical protein [Okeania sp. SIO1I7]|uniref:hypothetical protein n=1 Tax=Okeania sp. SIO1I7 TaxID=2607772 RepID=UPI0013F9D660|nr:hypothetical protein [Okeania sp. SIO1I7]NET28223.1 hypothetical protein [Okeania sp. SIO1I7]